ncbi:MAG: hypothetical protein JSR24_10810 [Proteobacteria bacterium]|nr:hypothetical protein [Pseudomonadota bacterium]
MSNPEPSGDGRKRMSTSVKLTLLGVGAVVALYSCAPVAGGGFGWLPFFWLFGGNMFNRGPVVTGPQTPGSTTANPSQTQPSQRGGFGSTAGEHGTTGTA